MNNLIQFLEEHMIACPSRQYLHIECPGCGMQRSFLALLKGDFLASLQLYPATIPILFLIGYTFLHAKYKIAQGAVIIKYVQLSIAILVATFYIHKILVGKIVA